MQKRVIYIITGIFCADLMNGEGGRVQVRQVADLLPGLVAVLVLEVAREILNDEPVHHAGCNVLSPRLK